MRHGPECLDAHVSLADRAGRSDAAADIGCSCPVDRRRSAVGSAAAEFHDGSALRRPHDAVGLRRDQTLVVDHQQDHRLDELCLHDRTADRQDRLTREDRGAFRDRPDIAFKLKILQIVEELFAHPALAAQELDVLFRKLQIFHVLDDLVQPREDRETAVIRHIAEKAVKIGDVILHACFKITVGHCQFIKVGQQRQVHFICHQCVPFRAVSFS